ncbi:hypothetical protein [Deinococcus frigens]|uniref:hypothetical protein n=1 Tax=Deinococcus frigens TaxID=249403 RepID=UPI0039F01944
MDRQWYYGVKLAALVSDQGLIHGFISAPANTEERFLAEALWRFHHDPTAEPPSADALQSVVGRARRNQGQRRGFTGPVGPCFGAGLGLLSTPILADDGYAGEYWQAHWRDDLGASYRLRLKC